MLVSGAKRPPNPDHFVTAMMRAGSREKAFPADRPRMHESCARSFTLYSAMLRNSAVACSMTGLGLL